MACVVFLPNEKYPPKILTWYPREQKKINKISVPSIIILANSNLTEIIFSTDSWLELSSWMNDEATFW